MMHFAFPNFDFFGNFVTWEWVLYYGRPKESLYVKKRKFWK